MKLIKDHPYNSAIDPEHLFVINKVDLEDALITARFQIEYQRICSTISCIHKNVKNVFHGSKNEFINYYKLYNLVPFEVDMINIDLWINKGKDSLINRESLINHAKELKEETIKDYINEDDGFVERLKIEKKELEKKIIKLREFQFTEKYDSLSKDMKALLENQLHHMEQYHKYLKQRLDLINDDLIKDME